MAISRRDQTRRDAGTELVAEACGVMARYAAVWEWFTTTTFDDGSARTLPTLTLFMDGRLLKGCLNDRAEGLVAFVTGSSFTAILEAMNEGLEGDCLDWRRANQGGKKR